MTTRERRPGSRITDVDKLKFLKALCGEYGFENMSVGGACRVAKIDRRHAYRLKEDDKEFSEAWDAAYNAGTDMMEDEAARRAFRGVMKPVYQQGHRVGSIREFSDRLAELMLRKRNPAFKDRHEVENKGKVGVVILSADEADI